VLQEHLNTALRCYRQALDITPADDHGKRGITENQLGNVYSRAGDTRQALRHYQQSIQHKEARGDIYEAGQTRFNIALLLADDGQISAALHNFEQAGPGAASAAGRARQLITYLEHRGR
jgi:tetratricopeptide (TPR) repeat protein